MSTRRVVSVSRLVSYLKQSMENDPVLNGFLVEGEISNLRKPYTGHWYFSLKDSSSSISCVMFARANSRLLFAVNNGDKVIIRGSANVYPATGSLQVIVSDMKQSGLGELYIKFEQLKKKLSEEGLFDEAHKKPLPPYPFNIALVSGNDTAGRKDVLVTMADRWPCAQLTDYPCPVQGTDAPPKIIEALRKADQGGHDLIILARGGGSFEELWCFNDEALARFIYNMNTPVVTGIGHETDFTLCDYVADLRSNTPTGTVKDACPDISQVHKLLMYRRNRITAVTDNRLSMARQLVNRYAMHPVMRYPEKLYADQIMKLDHMRDKLMKADFISRRNTYSEYVMRLNRSIRRISGDTGNTLNQSSTRMSIAVTNRINQAKQMTRDAEASMTVSLEKKNLTAAHSLASKAALLDAYSPLKILSRGYSIVTEGSEVIRSVRQLHAGDHIEIRLADGRAEATVNETEITDGHTG